jgi:hypothetical protein
MHLWDDKNGYQTMPYRKYAYRKDPHGQHLSMNGERLTRISKWEKEDNDDLFESDVPETTRVLVDIYDSDIPSTGHRVLTFDIEVEMITGLPTMPKTLAKMGEKLLFTFSITRKISYLLSLIITRKLTRLFLRGGI